jgi:hypothetical protein
MGSGYKRQPPRELLLSAAAIGEKQNHVWEESNVDLAQQITRVLG